MRQANEAVISRADFNLNNCCCAQENGRWCPVWDGCLQAAPPRTGRRTCRRTHPTVLLPMASANYRAAREIFQKGTAHTDGLAPGPAGIRVGPRASSLQDLQAR